MLADDPGEVVDALENFVVDLEWAAGGIAKAGQIVAELNIGDAPGIFVGDRYILPVVYRPRVTALNGALTAHLSGWDNDLWQLASWYREA